MGPANSAPAYLIDEDCSVLREEQPHGHLWNLLISGGDKRLEVEQAKNLNGYGCQPFPRPYEFSFASSTASTISPKAYAAAESCLVRLREGAAKDGLEETFDRFVEATRQDIRTLFDLDDMDVDVILSPSGTDAGLHALFLARRNVKGPMTSIVVASDETGSGIAHSASGRHFNTVTSNGVDVVKGEEIRGLGDGMTAVSVSARDANGHFRPLAEIDAEVDQCVCSAMERGSGVILQVMDHSKLGTRGPSMEGIARLRAKWGSSLQIVVDACQFRLSRAQLRDYLGQGCMVLITGSKFFAGPALSGALLVPRHASSRAADIRDVPEGLAAYSTAYDWPSDYSHVRAKLPKRPNIGQLLRWVAAIEEIRAYFQVPLLFRKLALAEFSAAVTRAIDKYPNLRLLPAPEWSSNDAGGSDEFSVRTIFPFTLTRSGRLLSLAETKVLFRALNEDASTLLPLDGDAARTRLAARCCHVGQPVAMAQAQGSDIGAVRICADARLVHESWFGTGEGGAIERFHQRLGQVRLVLEKLQLLLSHMDALGEHFRAAA